MRCLAAAFAALLFGPAAFEASLLSPRHHSGAVRAGDDHCRPRLAALPAAGSHQLRSPACLNLNALRTHAAGRDRALIVARILNYAEIVAALPADSEKQLIDQIVSRLSLGSKDRTFYPRRRRHLRLVRREREAVRPPHRRALRAVPQPGRGSTRCRSTCRSASASRSATAARSPTAWRARSSPPRKPRTTDSSGNITIPAPSRMRRGSCRCSASSTRRSTRARCGSPSSPSSTSRSRRIVGAEALARWTHPEKGPIAASEFIAAAEQHDRIGKLTDFVLEKSVAAAADINKQRLRLQRRRQPLRAAAERQAVHDPASPPCSPATVSSRGI